MIDHSFQNLALPALGLGAMRLPAVHGDDHTIDEASVKAMFDCA